MAWKIKPNFCTFVIPSLGRPSLKNSIQSLLDLTDWDWLCKIVLDDAKLPDLKGLNPEIDVLSDNHFSVSRVNKLGSAGLVRNTVLDDIDTAFTAFVDDDDFLDKRYLERLKYYAPHYDVVIFTYRDISNGNTQPPRNINDIVRCNVGISFAVKTEFRMKNKIYFQKEGVEDFDFLNQCKQAGAKYLLTHEIMYYVSKRGVWT